MPSKKEKTSTAPLSDKEIRVVVAALKATAVRPQINFDAMAEDLSFKNKLSAKNAFFKIMKDKLGNDPTKLPITAPGNKSSPLKRSREQVEDGPIDALRVKEPPTKRLTKITFDKSKMTLRKSIFDQDPEQEDGGVPLDNPAYHEVPVPSIEHDDEHATLDKLIDPRLGNGLGLDYVAWPGMPDISPSKRTQTANDFENDDDEVLHLFKGTRLKLNGPKNPYEQHFDSAQDELAALRAQDHGGQSADDEDSSSDSDSDRD